MSSQIDRPRMPRRRVPRCVAALLAVFAALSSSGAEPADAPLDAGLPSLRLIALDADRATVSYVPARVVVTDAAGQPAPSLVAKVIGGGQALVSGRVSLVADAQDVRTLEGRAARALGKPATAVKVAPKAFALWLTADGEEFFSQARAGGRADGVVIQGALKARPLGARVEAKAVAMVAWEQTIPPAGVQVTVDWKAIAARVATRGAASWTDGDVETLAQASLADGAIRIENKGPPPPDAVAKARRDLVVGLAAARMRGAFLTEPKPAADAPVRPLGGGAAPADGGVTVTYSVRKDVRIEAEAATIDLTIESRVDRSAAVPSTIVVSF